MLYCWAVFAKHCFVSHCVPTASRLGLDKRLGGDTVRTADTNWPKGYSILCKKKLWGKEGDTLRVTASKWLCGVWLPRRDNPPCYVNQYIQAIFRLIFYTGMSHSNQRSTIFVICLAIFQVMAFNMVCSL